MIKTIWMCVFTCFYSILYGQSSEPNSFQINQIKVTGTYFSDKQFVREMSGLTYDMAIQVPGLETEAAIKNLWKSGLFDDVQILLDTTNEQDIHLIIVLKERNRLSQISFSGIKQRHIKALKEIVKLNSGKYLSMADIKNTERLIRNYFLKKGYYGVGITTRLIPDKVLKQHLQLQLDINIGKKFNVNEIKVEGNSQLTSKEILKSAKSIQARSWWQPWRKSKYTLQAYEELKTSIIHSYRQKGFLDAIITLDTITEIDVKKLKIAFRIHEGNPYVIRNIHWTGNNKYNSEVLNSLVGLKRGDLYNPLELQQRLSGDPEGKDISSLYWDDGYLFFRINKEEVALSGDSVDIELNVFEGTQASISEIRLSGNVKTSDHVILRELRTLPGEKFSRSDLIRSQRELMALGYFNPQTLTVNPIPDAKTGTVALEYEVEEKPSDQFQLQFGYNPASSDSIGLGSGLVGTLQVNFNNFSLRKLFDAREWRYGIPSGDGQHLSLAVQSNGKSYQNYSLSFMEPWFGGKKPTSLGFSLSHQVFRTAGSDSSDLTFQHKIYNASLDYSTMLKFPDDYTRSSTSVGFKYYDIKQPGDFFQGFEDENRAFINILTLNQTFTRSTIDAPLFSRSGSIISLGMEFTPPYSLFDDQTNYEQASASEKFKLLEYHKIKFNSSFFFSLGKNLVLNLQANGGYIGGYNSEIGTPPFERFVLGGAGIGAGNILSGIEAIPLRGYAEQSFDNNEAYYPVYNRFVAELRYAININPTMPMWLLGFAEGGNGYQSLKDYNPFSLKKSLGAGIRIQLPMVGLLGLDWGYGFDTDESGNISKGQFHFIFGQRF